MLTKSEDKIKLGIIGRSLLYTLSPQIHKLFMKGRNPFTYDILELSSLNQLDKDKIYQYKGLNVTVPYKQEIIQFLDELKGDALALNAVNTIAIEYGKIVGHNTDTYGFMQMLKYNKINPKGQICVVLGSGGASQAIQYVLKQMGAAKLFVASRHPNGENEISYDQLKNITGYLIVNTTPVGTSPNIEDSPVGEEIVKNYDSVVDIIYNPSTTKFLSYGIKNKKIVANGLYMLVSQAIKSQEYWQGIKYNKSVVDNIYIKIKKYFDKKSKSNIYLTGMMSCGKSTIGKELAEKLGYDFIDLDKEIERRVGKTIPQIFESGEDYFRDYESNVLIDIALNHKKTVVATGGGIIKRNSNIYAMRISGLCIWIDRNLELIEKDCDLSSRPLLQGKNQYISTIYEERKSTYNYAKDLRIKNNEDVEKGVFRIIKIIKKGI